MPSHAFVVSGCGRSGTGHVAAVLTALGAPCGHEAIFHTDTFADGGRLMWPKSVAGDASWLAAPYLGKLPEGASVLHQVREPMAVIRSILRSGILERDSAPQRFAAVHIPELALGGPTVRAMRYWIEWNRLVEAAADYDDLRYRRHRLEDLDVAGVRELCAFLGLERSEEVVKRVLDSRPRDLNTRGDKRRDPSVTWESLPKGALLDELVELAQSYGYDPGSVERLRAS
ncbi:MAG: hypothetical protein R3F49_21460 [Planctomycetota bacterium]